MRKIERVPVVDMGKMYSTEILESPKDKYLKVFMLDDFVAEELKEILIKLREVSKVNITESQSNNHIGKTLTIYRKPMVEIKLLENIVKESLDNFYSGVVKIRTETISDVKFKDIEKKIMSALDKAQATIDLSVAWFTNEALQKKLLEKQEEGCKVRVMIDANYTNQKHGVDLTPFEHKAVKADRTGIMHYKFCVIDNNITIHGSYNWTINAETKNDEEISVHENDVNMASEYTKEFNRKWENQ